MILTEQQTDALQELLNIGVGRAASMLQDMIQSRIRLQVPFVKLVTTEEFENGEEDFGSNMKATVELGFTGPFSGTAALLFPTDSASKLVAAITGEEVDSDNLDAVTSGTLTEVGNIVMNGVMGSISNVISKHFDYAIPNYVEGTLESFLASKGANGDTRILLARARFAIADHQIEGDIMLIFDGGSLEALLEAIGMVEAN